MNVSKNIPTYGMPTNYLPLLLKKNLKHLT